MVISFYYITLYIYLFYQNMNSLLFHIYLLSTHLAKGVKYWEQRHVEDQGGSYLWKFIVLSLCRNYMFFLLYFSSWQVLAVIFTEWINEVNGYFEFHHQLLSVLILGVVCLLNAFMTGRQNISMNAKSSG